MISEQQDEMCLPQTSTHFTASLCSFTINHKRLIWPHNMQSRVLRLSVSRKNCLPVTQTIAYAAVFSACIATLFRLLSNRRKSSLHRQSGGV